MMLSYLYAKMLRKIYFLTALIILTFNNAGISIVFPCSHPDISTLRIPVGEEFLRQRLRDADERALPQQASSVKISASLLSVENPNDYPEQSIRAIQAGAGMIHLDIIGGRGKKTAVSEEGSVDTSQLFTPDAIERIKSLAHRQGVSVQIDCHIMDPEPGEALVRSYLDVGADRISLHWEAFSDKQNLIGMLKYIKSKDGVKAGIALRPDADIKEVTNFILENSGSVDYVSQGGIKPCLGGQIFIYSALDNIAYLNSFRQANNLSFEIMVDGGIEPEISGRKAMEAGADILVAGSAVFGIGNRDAATMEKTILSLRDASEVKETSIYDIIAKEIAKLRSQKKGKLWVRISSYHGGGKTYTTTALNKRLRPMRLDSVEVGLDISWTDRKVRENWKMEAGLTGPGHAYFDGMTHWREEHSERALEQLASRDGVVKITDCYDFDTGTTTNTRSFNVGSESIMLVDGVYVDSIENIKWDLTIYVISDIKDAKARAMERDEVKVHRPKVETSALYEQVYEPTYRDYEAMFKPRETADVVIDAININNPRIIDSKIPLMVLECTKCRHQYLVKRQSFCFHCGQELGMRIIGPVDFMGSIDNAMKGMWRFHRLMPIAPEYIVTAGEGNTPVVYMDKVSKWLGIELYIKLETVNPTGTFKDREGSYVISSSRQEGQDNVVMQSTGNTAIAITHYAGLSGMRSWAFIPVSSLYKLLMPPRGQNNHIIAVSGHPKDTKALADDFAARYGYPKISPFYERCEANATQAYEICEDILKGSLPNFDFYVQTIAAGMGPIGFWIGMARVSQWTGSKIKAPRILAVEIDEFAPIQKAWDLGLEEVGEEVATPLFPEKELFEPTLWTTNIRKYYPFLRGMLRESDGMLTAVSPEEVRNYIERYGILDELKGMGYSLADTEKASFVGFTGLAKQVESGKIPKGSRVILMLTGKGNKHDFSFANPDTTVAPDTDLDQLHKIAEGQRPVAVPEIKRNTDI